MEKIGIYKITSPSGKVYIGQSVDIEKRFKTYLRYSCKSQPKLLSSLRYHGSENHIYEILTICSKEELPKQEKYFVDLLQTFNSSHGLNIRDGGGNQARLSDEQKEKISNSLKGVKHSQERIEKNRASQLGKKLTEEHKRNISINNTRPNLGKKASKETRDKMSRSRIGKNHRLGYKLTIEQIDALRVRMTGSSNPNFGKKRTEESKNKTSESLKRYYINKKMSCQM